MIQLASTKRGKETRKWARQITKLRFLAEKKRFRFHSDAPGSPSESQNRGFRQQLEQVESVLLPSEIAPIEETPLAERIAIERRVRKELYG